MERTKFICRPCWQRTERRYRRRIRDVEEQVGQEDNQPVNTNPIPTSLDLPGLLRAPNTSNSCLFQHCVNESRRRIPENMLCRYSYFVPESARVCSEHLEQNLWHLLLLQDNASKEFTAAQIRSIVSILQRYITQNIIDFEQYENMTPDEFYTFAELLEDLPRLRSVNKRKSILAAVLVKNRRLKCKAC